MGAIGRFVFPDSDGSHDDRAMTLLEAYGYRPDDAEAAIAAAAQRVSATPAGGAPTTCSAP